MILYESEKFKVIHTDKGEEWIINPGTSWIEAHSIYYEFCNQPERSKREDDGKHRCGALNIADNAVRDK